MALGYTRSDIVLGLKGQMSRSIALHNDTSFQSTIALHSHWLGGDTCTVVTTVLHWHSLGGDTDEQYSVSRGFELCECILVLLV